MKIIQVCQRLYYGGGQERHVLNISKNFVKMGHEVTIVTSEIGVVPEFKSKLKLGGVRVKRIEGIKLDEPANQVLFPGLLSFLAKQKFDVIHAHGALCQSSQFALVAAKYKKKPIIFTPHYHPWNVYDKEKIRLIRKYFEKMITVPVICNASATIAVSDYEKELFVTKYPLIKPEKIKVIPNGVDIDFIENSSSRRNVRKKYNIPEGKKYILFFGATTDLRKGIHRAIEMFKIVSKRNKDAHLIILGVNTEKSIATRNLIKKFRLSDKVSPCGYVSDDEKVAFLRMSQVLVAPTIYEAFGITLAEAMYARVPVVATSCGGIPYVLKHGEHGYLVGSYKSTYAFAKYTLRLLSDEKLRKRLGNAGHKRVVSKFQWLDISKKILALYESLVKNG